MAGIVFCLRASEKSNLSVPSVAKKLKTCNISGFSTYKGAMIRCVKKNSCMAIHS